MSNRKNIVITDDNYDLEFEWICYCYGFPFSIDNTFVKELPADFSKSIDDLGEEVYSKSSSSPNYGCDCSLNTVEHILAYEFANGFMVFKFTE